MINVAVFALKHWRLILPLLSALVIAGAYYGGKFSGYQAGKKQAQMVCSDEKVKAVEAAMLEANKASRNLERNMKDAKSKEITDTDNSLRSLGIMRDIRDR